MKQYIIIGNSAAGISAVEAIRKTDKASKVTVISNEDYNSYCRCLISYYLAGDVKEENIWYRPEIFYKENNVGLELKKEVARVDTKKNRVVCADKSQFSYDSLLVATGASPKFPEIKGIKKKGVFGFRTLKDANTIKGLLPITKTACVLGGGLIGLKAAYALKKQGIDVKVIVKSKQILSQSLDQEAAGLVQQRLEEHGIELILGQDALEAIGNGEIKALKLESGKVIATSLVIVGKSVTPNIGLVKDTNIKINEGIVTNELLCTNIPNIYAAGDVCENLDMVSGKPAINALWPVAVEQGKAAGANMAGENIRYEGSIGMNSIEFFGLPVISMGMTRLKDPQGYEEFKVKDPKAGIYKKIILKNNRLIGAITVGNITNAGVFLRIIREKIDVSPFKDKLLQENFGYPDIMEFVKDKEKVYV